MERPKVGVGVFIIKDGKILMQKRLGSHGEGTWSLPGGHLEFKEKIEECAKREVMEEFGIEIKNLKIGPFTQDVFEKENKHYITIFVLSEFDSGNLKIAEPDKTSEVKWVDWNKLPTPLFVPIANLIKQNYDPVREFSKA